MGTITVATLLTRARLVLQDAAAVRWTDNELLDWLNAAQREIALYKPNASSKTITVQLSAGTKQTTPADTSSLLDITRNMGTNGTTPGRVVRIIDRERLDTQVPNWHSATASSEVRHYIYSNDDLHTFYVYPPQPASNRGYVEMVYSYPPAEATLGGAISIDDVYEAPLLDGVLYRAYSKDVEQADSQAYAQAYMQKFLTAVSGKTAVEATTNPNNPVS